MAITLKKTVLAGLVSAASLGSFTVSLGLPVALTTSIIATSAQAQTQPQTQPQTATATDNKATATANAATANSTLQSHTVEDMVAISKVAKQNEAVNDAVFGNEAINETLNNDALPINPNSNTATAEAPTTAPGEARTPRQSTQAPVAAEKLILNHPVIDEARVLSASDKQALEEKLRGIYQQGLAQAAVVIVPTTNGQDIFDYSMAVADKWQLGNKDTDNGLLMVVSINDRKMYILTGKGLEGTVPDAIAKRIISDDITPLFKQGDYAGGINAGINRIEERLTTDPEILKQADANKQTQSQQQGDTGGIPIIFLLIFGFIGGTILTSILGRFLGSLATAGGVTFIGATMGAGFFTSLLIGIILMIYLMMRGGGGRGGRGGGGFIILPGGGGFGGGGFGGGGFGDGGFSGGGGDFGGGGAGGDW